VPTATFIIHLKDALPRKKHVEWLKSHLPGPAHLIHAVRGADIPQADVASIYVRDLHRPKYPFKLRAAEIGCFLSHRKAWSEIVDRNLDFALVVEDDIQIDSHKFNTAFELAARHIADVGLVRFPKSGREIPAKVIAASGECRLIRPVLAGLGMHAQLISRDCAVQMLAGSEMFDRPVDTLFQMTWATQVQAFSVTNCGISEISNSLGGSTISRKNTPFEIITREVLRPVYRLKLALKNSSKSARMAKT